MGFGKVIVGTVYVFLALASSSHAVLKRRDPHAALWWVVVSWMFPIAGPFLYYFFGINRIERKAARLRKRRISSSMVRPADHSFTSDNRVEALVNGEQAYPAMVRAIDEAKASVGLATYIFNDDSAGQMFIDALARASARKVAVRVLIDDVGAGFFWSSVYKKLQASGVPVAYFLPALAPWRMAYLNMRNHRKILTVDGKIAFTGGMNINAFPVQDIQFRLEGPEAARIQETFRLDWAFTTGEYLGGEDWFPKLSESGRAQARSISSGPDEDLDHCRWTILSALAKARKSVRMATPYFLPDASLVTALNLAAMSGVKVNIVLPRVNDLALVRWASQAMLWQVLQRGCRVWRTPPPFDHSKILVVDDAWVLFGSSNWDRRSLRLNFEFDVECQDPALAVSLARLIDGKIASAREVTLAEMDSRPLPVRLRDGAARLFFPLL